MAKGAIQSLRVKDKGASFPTVLKTLPNYTKQLIATFIYFLNNKTNNNLCHKIMKNMSK